MSKPREESGRKRVHAPYVGGPERKTMNKTKIIHYSLKIMGSGTSPEQQRTANSIRPIDSQSEKK